MGNSRSSLHLQPDELDSIQEETGFNQKQIESLYTRWPLLYSCGSVDRFLRLDKNEKGHLGREDFLRIPELAINPLGDRIVHAFCTLDNTSGEPDQVDFRGFLRLLARFQPTRKGSQEESKTRKLQSRTEKFKFAFSMYDLDGDGCISKEELLAVLTMMVGANVTSDQLLSITERMLLETDLDQDGFITFEEFQGSLDNIDIEKKMSIRFLK